MADAQLVPNVGIVDRQIRDHEVGDQQLLEHVGADVAGAHLLVGAEQLQPRRLQRRLDVLRTD